MVLLDPELTQAVSKILIRSERVMSLETLRSTYVDTGVLPQLDNSNNQIIYGRRGTGKSHVLRILGSITEERGTTKGAYIDLRVLGSTQQATDPNRPFPQRCVGLFRDFLLAIYDALLEVATDPLRVRGGSAIDKVEEFGEQITSLVTTTAKRDVASNSKSSARGKLTLGVELSAKPKLTAKGEQDQGAQVDFSESFTEIFEDSLVYASLRKTCEAALRDCGLSSLLILIDEWTTLPPDIQPFFAEFLKRTLLPSPLITLKIGSLEYRSRFTLVGSYNNIIGFEVGGDISANLDLDDYYVYDRQPDGVVQTFQDILFRHITAELPEAYTTSHDFVSDAPSLKRRLFTESATFVELVRAAEGVVRDFILIFNRAFFIAQRAGRSSIDVHTVREAARGWYETDKLVNLSPAQALVIHRIMTEVIGKKKARSFLLDRRHANNPMIQSLFDFRVVHVTTKGYSDRDNPGLRYNIYTLDYGTYVDLLQTQSQPELDLKLEIGEVHQDRVVPFSDRRSIRRVIVDPAMLSS